MKTLICPYTENCQMYQNWIKQTKDNRLNVITEDERINNTIDSIYSCLAITAIQDSTSEGGIMLGDLEKRLPNQENINTSDCAFIKSLNLLSTIKYRLK